MHTHRFVYILPVLAIALLSCKTFSGHEHPELANSTGSVKPDSLSILYIGTYTENEAHAGGKSSGIYVYEFNRNTGRLSFLSSSPQTVNPSYLVVDPDKQRLYAVNEIGNDKKPSGTLSAFRLTRQGKEIEFINSVPSQGNSPCYISLDKSGKLVMCANYGSGTVALFPVLNDGSLGNASSVDQHKCISPASRQESPHAHMIIPSPYNGFVYSCDLGTNIIYTYKLDTIMGKLLPAGTKYTAQPGAGPRHLAFHPFRNFAYAVNELNGTVEIMKVDSITGELSRIQVISTVDSIKGEEAACADIHLTPSGKFLYASNRGTINNLAIYSVDQETGKLKIIGHQPVKGKIPRSFVIDPTGTFLLVANQNSDNVVTFRIDQSNGKLIDTGLEVTVPNPVCLKFFR
jgi:6-phosphogluconolactonase